MYISGLSISNRKSSAPYSLENLPGNRRKHKGNTKKPDFLRCCKIDGFPLKFSHKNKKPTESPAGRNFLKWSSIFLFFRKILSTSNRRIFRVSKGGAFSLLEKFSGRNWNFILTQKEFEHRENGRKEIRTSDLYS